MKNITIYVSGYTETDTTGMLSPPTVWRFSVAADVDSNVFLFLLLYLESIVTVVLCRFWLQCSHSLKHSGQYDLVQKEKKFCFSMTICFGILACLQIILTL